MSKQSYRELKSLAKTQRIKGYYKLKKAELVKELKIEGSADTSLETKEDISPESFARPTEYIID